MTECLRGSHTDRIVNVIEYRPTIVNFVSDENLVVYDDHSDESPTIANRMATDSPNEPRPTDRDAVVASVLETKTMGSFDATLRPSAGTRDNASHEVHEGRNVPVDYYVHHVMMRLVSRAYTQPQRSGADKIRKMKLPGVMSTETQRLRRRTQMPIRIRIRRARPFHYRDRIGVTRL